MVVSAISSSTGHGRGRELEGRSWSAPKGEREEEDGHAMQNGAKWAEMGQAMLPTVDGHEWAVNPSPAKDARCKMPGKIAICPQAWKDCNMPK